MFCKCFSAFVDGITSISVTVEADIGNGMPGFEMVGLLSCEVKDITTSCLIQRSPRICAFKGLNGRFTALFHRFSRRAA